MYIPHKEINMEATTNITRKQLVGKIAYKGSCYSLNSRNSVNNGHFTRKQLDKSCDRNDPLSRNVNDLSNFPYCCKVNIDNVLVYVSEKSEKYNRNKFMTSLYSQVNIYH